MNDEILESSYKYYQEVGSLTKTALWLKEVHDITWNRHKLSQAFHRKGWDVNPPNGRPPTLYYQQNSYLDEYNRLAAEIVNLAWDDIYAYRDGNGLKINYMSACWYVSSGFYETCLESLKLNAESSVGVFTIPPDIDPEFIIKGRELYEQGMRHWIYYDRQQG